MRVNKTAPLGAFANNVSEKAPKKMRTGKQEHGEFVAWEQFYPDMGKPQRLWVGLTDEEAQWLYDNCRTPSNLIDMVEAKLKEKNT